MPATIEIKDAHKTIQLWDTAATWDEDEHFTQLYDQLDRWNAALPLASCTWETLPPEGDVAVYRLLAVAKDGRTWKIKVLLRPGIDAPLYDFGAGMVGRMEEREFEVNREVRLTLVHLVRVHGVSKMEATWF